MGQQINMVLPVLVLVLLQINLSSLSFVPNQEILEKNLDNPNPELRALAESRIDIVGLFTTNWQKMLAKLANDLISLLVKTLLKYMEPAAAPAAGRHNMDSNSAKITYKKVV